MRLKRSYSDFKTISSSKGLEIFFGDIRLDSYHLLMLDGALIYECFIPKDGGSDQLDFETNYLSLVGLSAKQEPDWDDFITSFPATNKELHTYKKNSVTVQEILVTYENAQKKQITRIQKTRF